MAASTPCPRCHRPIDRDTMHLVLHGAMKPGIVANYCPCPSGLQLRRHHQACHFCASPSHFIVTGSRIILVYCQRCISTRDAFIKTIGGLSGINYTVYCHGLRSEIMVVCPDSSNVLPRCASCIKPHPGRGAKAIYVSMSADYLGTPNSSRTTAVIPICATCPWTYAEPLRRCVGCALQCKYQDYITAQSDGEVRIYSCASTACAKIARHLIKRLVKAEKISPTPSFACASCLNATAGNMLCGACKAVYYCSTACQRTHWDIHKTTCNQPTIPLICDDSNTSSLGIARLLFLVMLTLAWIIG